MNIFVFGSSIVSSYWNGAATYYRGIYKYMARRGHQVSFAEPDAYGRQQHRDDDDLSYINSIVYQPAEVDRILELAAQADIVVKHSGIGVDDDLLETAVLQYKEHGRVVFWDVDAPATINRLDSNERDPFRKLIGRYDAILTYGGGPGIREAYLRFGAKAYYSIYNGLDPETHHPVEADPELLCDVAFLGNRLPDREVRVDELFLRAATLAPDKLFVLGGEGWGDKAVPPNVRRIGHVSTHDHNRVNCSAGMVLNINRSSMATVGFSPPTRVFEAAGAGACMLCDDWPGMDDCFQPEKEILIVRTASDIVDALHRYTANDRKRIGVAFRLRALSDHTYARRAEQVECAFLELYGHKRHMAAVQQPAAASMEEPA